MNIYDHFRMFIAGFCLEIERLGGLKHKKTGRTKFYRFLPQMRLDAFLLLVSLMIASAVRLTN